MIACINKAEGPTSFSVVQSVKKALNVKKAGHIGTLDPMAKGVLPVCLNGSTRIIQFLVNLTKVYRATLALGASTDSQDRTGKVLATTPAGHITEAQVRDVLQSLVGKQLQTPPMFSAKKKNGVPLYKLARKGVDVEREPSPIHIYSIEFLGKEGDKVSFRVHCSSGTYIRTLCHDAGNKLGCGAHLDQLERERVGDFRIENSISLEDLKTAHANATVTGQLLAMDSVLDFLPEIKVSEGRVRSIKNGISLSRSCVESYPSQFKPGVNMRVTNGDSRLIAIVEPLVDQDKFATMPPDEIAFKLKRVLA